MIGLDELVLHLEGLETRELLRWIERRWLLPERRPSAGSGEAYFFHEVDVARAELIVEIRREFALDDEALDLVLSLLDQLYGLRRALKRVCEAVATQPAEVQQAIARALAPSPPAKE
jgi:chaperone modulatory protein CbpM